MGSVEARKRKLGPFEVAEIGLGCMNLSHAYGVPPEPAVARNLLETAVDLGIDHFDSAALYGFGRNEDLLGPVLRPHRGRIVLATKCGVAGVDGKRVIDGRPETIKRTCEESLRRLETDVIDLCYLHRWDKRIPIEDSIGAMVDLIAAGKIRAIGLSEVSAPTLRKVHSIHPVAAVQTEYSLWTRNAEVAVLDACRELDVAFVAFSPLGRGFLTGTVTDPSAFVENDIRRKMPRFQEPHFTANLALLEAYRRIARTARCTMPQLALAWLLNRGNFIHAIPGTTSPEHLRENRAASSVRLSDELVASLDAVINPSTVRGPRYGPGTQAEIDTEEIPISAPRSSPTCLHPNTDLR